MPRRVLDSEEFLIAPEEFSLPSGMGLTGPVRLRVTLEGINDQRKKVIYEEFGVWIRGSKYGSNFQVPPKHLTQSAAESLYRDTIGRLEKGQYKTLVSVNLRVIPGEED